MAGLNPHKRNPRATAVHNPVRPRPTAPIARSETPSGLTHLDAQGRAHMVDVGDKSLSRRVAVAQVRVLAKPETLAAIAEGRVPKGDVAAVARIAGILAAKRTGEWIPLCHPLPLDQVAVEIRLVSEAAQPAVEIRTTVAVTARTGVEMEALCAAAAAALTVYDMAKAIDPGMIITDLCLLEKSGGRRGPYRRAEDVS